MVGAPIPRRSDAMFLAAGYARLGVDVPAVSADIGLCTVRSPDYPYTFWPRRELPTLGNPSAAGRAEAAVAEGADVVLD
jgi:hypothetical protein